MTSVVVLHGQHLCQVFRRLRNVAAAQGLLALVAIPFVIFTPRLAPATIVLVVALAAYVIVKGYAAVRHVDVLKQMRLEERFLRELPRDDQLSGLLSRDNHFWSTSRLWIGLKAVLIQPLPRLLLVEEKRRRIERHFHRAIRDLQPRQLNLHAGAFLAIGMIWHLARALEGATGEGFVMTGVLFAIVLSLEVYQTGVQWMVRHQFTDLERALCEWTMSNRFEQGIPIASKHYVHRLLYQSRPWFLPPGARTVTRTYRFHDALREVA